jgi:hypothetical protein
MLAIQLQNSNCQQVTKRRPKLGTAVEDSDTQGVLLFRIPTACVFRADGQLGTGWRGSISTFTQVV